MEKPNIEYGNQLRWFALTRINILSALSQIVQIGTVTPLLSLSLEQQGVEPAKIGVVVSASWLAILLLYKWVPRLLARMGLVRTNILSAALTIAALIGMPLTTHLALIFSLNFLLGIGLILRWIACDTWIVAVASKDERGRAIGVHEALMGLGIAIGPLLLIVFGVGSAAPYYACAFIVLMSGALALTLKTYDTQPKTPAENHHGKLFSVIPTALCGAFIAGFSETSAVSFLAGYSLSAGYLLTAATLLISVFGIGGTVLQLPIGWMADRSSYKIGQLVCSLILLLGSLAIPLSQPHPWLATMIVFLWGGAIGGMNTLAVIEVGDRAGEHQVSTAMTAIAMFYTLGSVLGPIVTGATMSYVSEQGLMISVGAVGALFIAIVLLRSISPAK
ncbi:MFS transporter [Pseudomonas sp. ChxA]|uniref:MFS transporter n=1 Tax=Pseudomonas fluorescens TaxID=294 RepID=A0A2T0HRN6_PSEFL|nr:MULTISPECIES: MFS transporter [Pseudomonas]AOA05076.1 MFS transporter [Pseudomonas sp. TMW 2.1634]MDL2185931.1 MFS transporter [Pseudomonas sp. ChxA]MQT41202.1 MFS transporter [Pseudomonas sp. FSL R10-0765]MQT99425.1 MFS transporter [Pseudomonas sp. FSL R10-2245]OOW02181.1 MFS transporter [Pseudomonas sp. MF6394]